LGSELQMNFSTLRGRMAESSVCATVAVASAKRLAAPSLTLHHPGLAAVPAIKIDGAVTVEHHMGALLDHAILEAGREREHGIRPARMPPPCRRDRAQSRRAR
jgi:hypothetical protein